MTETTALDLGDVDVGGQLMGLDEHPILRDEAFIPTRPMEEFVNVLLMWLDNLLPGGMVWGTQRIGKTHALRCLDQHFESMIGHPIPTVLVSASDEKNTALTENRFFTTMLTATGYALPDSGTAIRKRNRLIEFMVGHARAAKEHRYILFIDEAQWLADVQFHYLMDLHNQLKLRGVRLITVLMGQPELLSRREDFRSADKHHILGRFMAAVHHYTGVVDRADFHRILTALDEHSEYPEGSGISYTAYFVPEAFTTGWRMAAQTEIIWDTLQQVLRQEKVGVLKEVPMQAMMALVRMLLRVLGDLDEGQLTLSPRQVEDAIYRVAILQLQDHALRESAVKLPATAI